jgi:NAD(P)-dependent dehydrogenase (short-subunit alcohol dehydrogenase family)
MLAAYCAAKAGVTGLVRALAAEPVGRDTQAVTGASVPVDGGLAL